MTFQALLPNVGGGTWRRGTWWTKRTMTVTMTMEAEASKAGDAAVAAVAREVQKGF